MAFCKKEMVLFFMVVMAALSVCMGGAEYTVGDDHGWNTGLNFTHWAESHEIKVNDTIVFKYKKGEHNVVRVSHTEFEHCTVKNGEQKSKYETGNDKIHFERNGHYFYLSSLKDDCTHGLKIALRVSSSDADKPKPNPPKSSPAPPVPGLSPPPSVDQTPKPQAPAPAPEKSKDKSAAAVSLSTLGVVSFVAMGLAAFVGGLAY